MRFRYLVLALVALLATVAVACDGDTSEPASTPTTAPQPTPSPTAAVETFSFDCDAAPRSSQPDASAFPLEITDSVDNTVTLEAPPQNIASLSAGHTEILYAIGASGQVGSVDLTSDCPQATDELPKVDAFTPSVEAIAAEEPDLVVIFFDPGDLQSSLQELDIPVLNLASPSSIAGVYEQIELLGEATGHSDEAGELVTQMRDAVTEVQETVAGAEDRPSVFHEIDTMYFTAGPGSFVGDLYDILGAENIAEPTGEPFPQLSAEAIIEADPEVIILADEEAGVTAESVGERPGWDNVAAVQNGRVHAVDPNIVSRPGPRVVKGLQALAELLYPEQF